MRNVFLVSLVLLVAVNCAPAPSDKVDLKKMRNSLLLADGSTISSAAADDYNPQLIAREDGTLILLFGSNRTCSPCTANNYHIFVATSVTPYDFYEIPRFNTPVVMNNVGTEITLGTSRANFNAFWTQNKISIAMNHGGQIKGTNILAANLASANTLGAPAVITNTTRASDTLLMVNFKDFTMLTVSGGVTRLSPFNSVSAGTVVGNSKLASANSAVLAHYAYTGYEDAIFYQDAGGLSSGRYNAHADEHFFFNDALTESGLILSYVSTMRTPYPVLDLFVFSAGTNSSSHDLYAVDSHTAATLFLLDGTMADYVPIYDGGNTNYPPYRMFVYSTAMPGGFGGISAADAMCNTDFATIPDINVYYEAMLSDSGYQRSSPLDLDLDWPIQPLSSYIRSDTGAAIKTSDASGFLQFPWTTAVGAGNVWTGLNGSWNDGPNVCDPGAIWGWIDSTAGFQGDYGSAASTTSTAIYSAAQNCNLTAKIYCVEVPHTPY